MQPRAHHDAHGVFITLLPKYLVQSKVESEDEVSYEMTLSIAKLSTLPVDILIDEEGNIVEAHYCKDTVDHMPIEKMISFAQGN